MKRKTENTGVIEIILLVLLGLGFFALQFKELFQCVIAMAAFSLFSALLFYLLHAPDVAIAEAAVGAGVATVIFIYTIRKTEIKSSGEKDR